MAEPTDEQRKALHELFGEKWEYNIITFDSNWSHILESAAKFNYVGQDGWELVTIDRVNGLAYFKRRST